MIRLNLYFDATQLHVLMSVIIGYVLFKVQIEFLGQGRHRSPFRNSRNSFELKIYTSDEDASVPLLMILWCAQRGSCASFCGVRANLVSRGPLGRRTCSRLRTDIRATIWKASSFIDRSQDEGVDLNPWFWTPWRRLWSTNNNLHVERDCERDDHDW